MTRGNSDHAATRPWDDRFLSYLYCFNVLRDYFECHEYGESLWLDTGRPIVLKGLIQAAVCLYHLHNGNVRGGWKMWQRARSYLAPSRPVYEGIDLDALTRDIDDVFAQVPSAWYTQVVAPEVVRNLHLPTVEVRIVDASLREQLSSWQLPNPPEND
jgi:hypothetical protein